MKEFYSEGVKCLIDMNIDKAIELVEDFLKENIPGQMSLNVFSRRYAMELVLEELKKRMSEYA